MRSSCIHSFLAVALFTISAAPQLQAQSQNAAKPKLYNTVKQKLADGKQVFSFTQNDLNIEQYCEYAKHYDYAWFEMQHRTLSYADVEKMINACPNAPAIPMIRLPDAQEHHIQLATDIGALGVIIPTVDDVERALDAAKWALYPPTGRRSSGGSNARSLWGSDYRETANDNMLVVVMIESPTGVANAHEIARVPGVDVVLVGNNDLSSFSGYAQTSEEYQRLITKIYEETRKAGKIFGQANATYATGHPLSKDTLFFQNGPSNDGWTPPARGGRPVNQSAPPEGER